MIRYALMTAGSIFLANAVLFPLDRRYQAWKKARPEVVLRRNWRGQLVPDLTIKRIERGVLLFIGMLVCLGLAVGYTIMAPA